MSCTIVLPCCLDGAWMPAGLLLRFRFRSSPLTSTAYFTIFIRLHEIEATDRGGALERLLSHAEAVYGGRATLACTGILEDVWLLCTNLCRLTCYDLATLLCSYKIPDMTVGETH